MKLFFFGESDKDEHGACSLLSWRVHGKDVYSNKNLSHKDFTGSAQVGAFFDKVDLSYANFNFSNLQHAWFNDIDFDHTSFHFSNLSSVKIQWFSNLIVDAFNNTEVVVFNNIIQCNTDRR